MTSTQRDATTALAFPGMGPTSYRDLAKFALVHPLARARFAAADEALGHRLLTALRTDADDYSVAAQVAFMVTSVALADWSVAARGVDPAFVVGPSFGAKPMAAFAGVLPFADAVRMTAGLAQVTEEYFATEHTELVTASFARVGPAELETLLAGLDAAGVWHETSCRVDESMHMITLPAAATEAFEHQVRAVGGMPLYTMRPPMHASVFDGLRSRAAEVLAPFPFADPRHPVVSDLTGAVLTTGAQVRELLLDALVTTVDWPGAVATLHDAGVRTLCVAGPDALFGRVACTRRAFTVVPADPRRALQPAA